jgi:hypothetical protein
MTANTQPHAASSTFAARFGTQGLLGIVRALNDTMLDVWNDLPVGRRQSHDRTIGSLRGDCRSGDIKPVWHVMRLAVAAIDAGVSVARVTEWFRDAVTYLEQYAARKEGRTSIGVLPFPVRLARVWSRETTEQCEADCACIAIGEGMDLDALRKARVECQEHRDEMDAQIALISERIVELEGR